MSPIVISEVLGLFIITLTADDKYSLRNRENLPQVNSDAIAWETKKYFWIFCFIDVITSFASFLFWKT